MRPHYILVHLDQGTTKTRLFYTYTYLLDPNHSNLNPNVPNLQQEQRALILNHSQRTGLQR